MANKDAAFGFRPVGKVGQNAETVVYPNITSTHQRLSYIIMIL